jgi:hypothetical protein
VYRFGIEPSAVDIITRMKGLSFDECFSAAKPVALPNGNTVRLFILNDIENLSQPE